MVCSAVIKDVTSFGDIGGGPSTDGVAEPFGGLPSENVCRRDANLFDAGLVLGGGGDDGRLDANELGALKFLSEGDGGMRLLDPGEGVGGAGFFFTAENDLRNDHSDSNCTDRNSFESGEYSRRAASRRSSIRLSAKRMMKTVVT